MGRLDFKDNGDEHNSYQSYTDLMSGFLIVFMIASIVAIVRYKDKAKQSKDRTAASDKYTVPLSDSLACQATPLLSVVHSRPVHMNR